MPLSYRLLRSFRAVARQGSITAAANELHVSQPALTQTMHQLEEIVGTTLLSRGSRGVVLTQAGREFLLAAEQLLEHMDRVLDDIRGYARLRRGSLTVAVLPSLASGFMPKLIGSFKKLHPQIHVSMHDALNEQIEDLVTRGLSDIGLTVALSSETPFESLVIASDQMSLICEENHPLARYSTVSWDQVAKYDYVALSRQSSTRRIIEQSFAAAGHYVHPVLEVQNIAAVAHMVEAGLGVTIVPHLAAPLIGAAKVVWRPMVRPRVRRQLRLIKIANRVLSPAAQAFWQHLLDNQHVFQTDTPTNSPRA